MIPLNTKFSRFLLTLGQYEQKKDESVTEFEPLDIHGQLMIQPIGNNKHNGYEEFVKKLEKEAKQNSKKVALKSDVVIANNILSDE